uniref:ATP synthase F(0) complex subunit e, mitochondrial n=1 Tax=Lepeophtheirus salmonis TaxID=72036 RepID=A0A0K2TWE1_LEPSM
MMASHIDLGPIGKVSPLVKLCRWTALSLGVYWGIKRYNVHKATEDEIRAYNARMKPVWDLEKAQMKAKSNREQLLILAKETGVVPPPEF